MKKCIALPAACAALLLAPWPACAGSSGRAVPGPALLKRMNEG